MNVPVGTTSVIFDVFIQDTTKANGGGLTGLTFNSAGLIITHQASVDAAPTVYAQIAGNIETITTIGTFAAPTASKCRFKEIDAANRPGDYQVMIADARWNVANSKVCNINLSGAANMAQTKREITQDAVPTSADPLASAVPGAYGAGTAGYVLGTNLNATVSSRLATSGYTAPDNASITTIVAYVDELESRLTAQRAGYLDELGAANIPADIDILLARLTALRAGYLDELAAANLPADVDTLLARLSAARALLLDNLALVTGAGVPASVVDLSVGAINQIAARIIADHGAGLYTGGGGSGANQVVLHARDVTLAPIGTTLMYITTDTAGTAVVAGARPTTLTGNVTFLLDNGTYYVWAVHYGYNFPVPTTINVVGPATFNIEGTVASMALVTDVQIFNAALARLGADSIVAFADATDTARLGTAVYSRIREAVLRDAPWNCLKVRANLVADATAPTWGFTYRYALPATCLRVLRMQDENDYEWVIEGRWLLTDRAGAPIQYVYDEDDPSMFDPLLREALVERLAAECAFAVTGNANQATLHAKLYAEKVAKAIRADRSECKWEDPGNSNPLKDTRA